MSVLLFWPPAAVQATTCAYTLVDQCAGGGHTRIDISIAGGAVSRVVYATDEIRGPLDGLTPTETETLCHLVLRTHMAGKSRAQFDAELQSPLVVTI